jgi:sugar/nucleoside kinase (ribokinase family)
MLINPETWRKWLKSRMAEITGRKTPEEIARFLLDRGVKTVVIKMGKQGCYVCSDREK